MEWTGWRGPQRDGHVPWLPNSIPEHPNPVWKKPLRSAGVGGIAATTEFVFVSDREGGDSIDVFRCLDAETGEELWKVTNPAKGDLDYGNSPRATPLVLDDHAYFYGAFGHLLCTTIETGEVVWKKDVRKEFAVDSKLVWGHASSPIAVNGKLIINPGGPDASLVALDPLTGNVLWKTAGDASAFASFIVSHFGGQTQLIGYDATSIGGWNPNDGVQLWRHIPKLPNDFNVPTPILYGDQLILCTENNGTRLFDFDEAGHLKETPVAVNDDLAPDTHTPIVVGDRLFGVCNDLVCLDLKLGLKPIWTAEAPMFQHYASMIASKDKLMVFGSHGEVLLIDALAAEYKLLSKSQLIDDDSGVYSHPALVGNRLYIRGSTDIRCFILE